MPVVVIHSDDPHRVASELTAQPGEWLQVSSTPIRAVYHLLRQCTPEDVYALGRDGCRQVLLGMKREEVPMENET